MFWKRCITTSLSIPSNISFYKNNHISIRQLILHLISQSILYEFMIKNTLSTLAIATKFIIENTLSMLAVATKRGSKRPFHQQKGK